MFSDYASIDLASVLLITNVTRNVIIYNFAADGFGGSVTNATLTLEYDTATMSDSDSLQIWYYDTALLAATDTGVAAVKTAVEAVTSKLSADPATDTGVEAVKTAVEAVTSKLSADPATDRTLAVLIQIRKLLESNSVVDNKTRQKVVVEAVGNSNNPSSTECGGTLPVSGSVSVTGTVNITGTTSSLTGNVPTSGAPWVTTAANASYTPVWEGPVDQRWRIIDAARTAFATGVRPNLSFT